MQLAVSHIAWPKDRESEFLVRASDLGVEGLEIAPGRIWAAPEKASAQEVKAYRVFARERGLKIVSLHALLYDRPELQIFGSTAEVSAVSDFLKAMCRVAAWLECPYLVLGSPKNRSRNGLRLGEAMEHAVTVFENIGREAAALGVCLLIEPLGPLETDFIVSAEQGKDLVDRVASPGFGLHLDAKALSVDSLPRALRCTAGLARHFHASEPDLACPGASGTVPHEEIGWLLEQYGYKGFVSIEMVAGSNPVRNLEDAVNVVKRCYPIRNPEAMG
jgi:sugar phosphate isomerase/epimerase